MIKVRGYHLDVYGHVNNARYLEFLEEARWALFDDSDAIARLDERGLGFAVVNVNISYRQPARLGDVLEIASSLASLGERSGVVRQVVRLAPDGAVVADADVTFAVFDRSTGRAVALTPDVRELVAGPGWGSPGL